MQLESFFFKMIYELCNSKSKIIFELYNSEPLQNCVT